MPINNSWRAVLILLICVGFTSAEGIEGSKYRDSVLCLSASFIGRGDGPAWEGR